MTNDDTLRDLNEWWDKGYTPLDKQTSEKWKEHTYWFAMDQDPTRNPLQQKYQKIMIYTTGRGEYKREAHTRAGRTFYFVGGSNRIRNQVEFNTYETDRWKIMKWNLRSEQFDIVYTDGI